MRENADQNNSEHKQFLRSVTEHSIFFLYVQLFIVSIGTIFTLQMDSSWFPKKVSNYVEKLSTRDALKNSLLKFDKVAYSFFSSINSCMF